MRYFRSARLSAILLAIAAVLGLVLANSPLGPGLADLLGTYLAVPGTPLELNVSHWISDGLLAVFFFIIAIELRHELTSGRLNTPSKALRPAIAALGGVVVPALVYLAIAGPAGLGQGWPIPTATDIAFALGVLALLGKGLPPTLRVFLLALAVIDDVVAILIIAIGFSDDVQPLLLVAAGVVVIVFGLVSRLRLPNIVQIPLLVVLAAVAWAFTYLGGVHATIAGVALGLVLSLRVAESWRHAIEPISNAVILPVFAFSAAAVTIPALSPTELSPAFWGIAIALPVGKIVGVTIAGWIAMRFPGDSRLGLPELVAVGALAGIGFTVSLLMNGLAFAGEQGIADQGVLAVLIGSAASIALAAAVIPIVRRRVAGAAESEKIDA